MSKIRLFFNKAPFPAVMTVISFLLGALIYKFGVALVVDPHYIKGLIFSVPFICFGIITFFTAEEKLNIIVSYVITGILIVVFFVGLAWGIVFAFLGESPDVISNTSKYERVLKVKGDSLTKHFPKELSKDAKNVVFRYKYGSDEHGEEFFLKFDIDSDYIDNYIEKFSKKARWIGKPSDSDAKENCVPLSKFGSDGYTKLPEDAMIYMFYNEPSPKGYRDYSSISFVAISKERGEMIFFAEHG